MARKFLEENERNMRFFILGVKQQELASIVFPSLPLICLVGFHCRRICQNPDDPPDKTPTRSYLHQTLRWDFPFLFPHQYHIRSPTFLPPPSRSAGSALSQLRRRFQLFSCSFFSFPASVSRVPNTSSPSPRGPWRGQEPAGSPRSRDSSRPPRSRRTGLLCMICITCLSTRSGRRRLRRGTGCSSPAGGYPFYVRLEMGVSPFGFPITKFWRKDQTNQTLLRQ